MQLISKIISTLLKERDKKAISIEDIAHYFNLNHSIMTKMIQKDMYSELEEILCEELGGKNTKETNQIISNLAELIATNIYIHKKDRGNIQVVNIKRLISKHYGNLKEFIENKVPIFIDGGLTSSTVSRLLKPKTNFSSLDLGRLNMFQTFLEQENRKFETDICLDDVCCYFSDELETAALTPNEIDNICGTYFYFKRTSYRDNELRWITISTIEFFRKSDNKVGFKYIKVGRYREKSLIEGNVIRDTLHSIKLIGFERGTSEKYRSLQIWGLSINIDLLSSGDKRYINGGVFEFDEATKKPFHTFVHISKISDSDNFNNNLNNLSESVRIEGINFLTLIHLMKIKDFKMECKGKVGENIEKHIKENYSAGNNKGYIDYIFDKLLLGVEELEKD